jgi:hypothetical protein
LEHRSAAFAPIHQVHFIEGAVAMLANILLGAFVFGFLAIVVLGHVLLFTAIWSTRQRPAEDKHAPYPKHFHQTI